jgi:hypothetical protein
MSKMTACGVWLVEISFSRRVDIRKNVSLNLFQVVDYTWRGLSQMDSTCHSEERSDEGISLFELI